MNRRRPRGSIEDLLPEDRVTWAREIWAERYEVNKLESGAWMLREAGKALGVDEEEIDRVIRGKT